MTDHATAEAVRSALAEARSVRRRPGVWLAAWFGVFVVAAFLGMLVSVLLMAVWPGAMTATGAILCTDDRPDAFVVYDTYNPRPGETVTTFTMYCVGPNGESTDVGFSRPIGLVVAFVTAVLMGLAIVFRVVTIPRRRRRRERAVLAALGLGSATGWSPTPWSTSDPTVPRSSSDPAADGTPRSPPPPPPPPNDFGIPQGPIIR